jgi:hypothetical protein
MTDIVSSAQQDELVARIASGDRDAFARLYRECRPDVFRFALHMCGAAWHARQLKRARFPVWAAAAALILVTVSLNWLVVRRPPVADVVASEPAADLAGFVAWPGASAWPPFESGSMIRVELPVSILPTLGLSAPSSVSGFVPADIVVGQDGLARAVRLVQQQ